ncbi:MULTISPECIES: MarR family winged helix-turn-helix transcriptional regulator [Subtercola]|uniref:MarR family transcriptional regulator n=1 Tax=Subtercola vilae TaxID=2056433 RepID=A0A4T2C905_9MICO|nr:MULTISPECIES: MarR family transcriptional regulator [Subtercola]MEA9983985.1 MarR family transcriptional regulator [Subtercola sp. RTI3]TIH40945.1 MarR family transcriptional regulator [Subtercola vilae]
MTSDTNHERWLSDDEAAAWVNFIAVVELLPGVLDTQLQHDADLTHFEYFTLAMLSEAPEKTLRMTALAAATNSTLPRLSHVVSRLEGRGYISRLPCAADRRATNAKLTEQGWQKVVATAPGHVSTVIRNVIAPLDAADVADLARITGRMLATLDPDGKLRPRQGVAQKRPSEA